LGYTHLGYPAQAGMYDLSVSHSVEPAALQSAIGLTAAQASRGSTLLAHSAASPNTHTDHRHIANDLVPSALPMPTCQRLAAQIGALSDTEPQTQLSTTPTTYQDLSQSTFVDPAELRAAIAASSSRA